MRLCLLALLTMASWAANTKVDFDPTNPEIGPFPTDYLTTLDTRQRTGQRVNLPLPDCDNRSSDCAELTLINELDGFNQNARITLHFTGPIQPETLRDHVYIAWLDPVPGRFGVYPAGKLTPVNELVYEPSTNTAFVKPDEILEGGRQYLIIVTSGVRDLAGDPVEPHDGYTACLAERIGGDYCRQLKAAVDRFGGLRIAGASLFTAATSTAFLEDARRIVQLTPTAFRRTSPVVTANTITGITFRHQARTSGNRFDDEVLPLEPGQLARTGRIAFFAFRSPSFLNAGIIATTPTGEPVPTPATTEEIHGHVWLPATPAPAGGYPVLLAGHGLTDSRIGMPTALAATAAGYAVVAISAVGHGYGPDSAYRFTRADGTVQEVPAPGRGVDRDGGGAIDSFEGCVVVFAGAPLIIRDCVRQTAVDYMQLVHAIREGLDVDGDGRRDLDPNAIQYFGQSLGGMYGTLLMAVEPEISAAVLNVPPGSGTETGRLAGSQALQFITLIALGLRQPTLLNNGLGFIDQMPRRRQPVSLLNVAGARAIQDFFERAEWLENLGAPQFYARHLVSATLPGVAAKRIFFQMAVGDQVAANASTSRLIRAANLREQTMLYRYDIVRSLLPGVPTDPHTFLIPQGPPETQLTGLSAILQGLRFLQGLDPGIEVLVGGRQVFETPPAELP